MNLREAMTILKPAIKALRPKQWIKNILIFAAPVAGASLANHIFPLVATFFVFCFASSLGYIYNDWTDRKSDAINPKKQRRPFASGELGIRSAIALSGLLVFTIIALLNIVGNIFLVLSTVSYLSTTLSYTKWLKNIPTVEIIAVASCFVIRSVAGSVISESPLSQWFFTVIAFGAKLIVSGKRLAEFLVRGKSRLVLESYSETFLRSLMVIGSSGTLFGFSLWTFNVEGNTALAQLSFFPFLICVFRLFWLLDNGKSQLSEDFPIQDPVLIMSLSILSILLLLVVYA